MLLFIDNFDSFTYNLVQCFQVLGEEVCVIRNNAYSLSQILSQSFTRLVIGPGPGTPTQAGISKELMRTLGGQLPILGVCLGHQCLGEIFGGSTVRAKKPMHGKSSPIIHSAQGLFKGLPPLFLATRYHSLVVERISLPSCLEVTAETEEGEIMGLCHRDFPTLQSVQFHPESVLTEGGLQIFKNFMEQ